jgi:hypothetical protein
MADDPTLTPATCPTCGRQFASPRLRALHRGEAHPDRLDDDDWAEVVDARAAESADLRRLRLRMALALVCLYFGFVVLYALVRLVG